MIKLIISLSVSERRNKNSSPYCTDAEKRKAPVEHFSCGRRQGGVIPQYRFLLEPVNGK